MCLDRITKRYETPTTEEQTAYKVVECIKSDRCYSCFIGTEFPFDTWISAAPSEVETESWTGLSNNRQQEKREKYSCGFHVIATKKEATKLLAHNSCQSARCHRSRG